MLSHKGKGSLLNHKACRYFYGKLVGAGFSFTLFIILTVTFTSIKLFDISELLATPLLWGAFYGYGILWSILVDVLVKVWPKLKRWMVLLYIIGGLVIFVILLFAWVSIIIAGSIGVVCALLFYFGVHFVRNINWLSIIFAVVTPFIFIYLSLNDFTKKVNWNEEQTESTYRANFDYFNGEHRIPFTLQKHDDLLFRIEFHTSDGWGVHIENDQGEYVPMIDKDDITGFSAAQTGDYDIVIRGKQAKGTIKVDWKINMVAD